MWAACPNNLHQISICIFLKGMILPLFNVDHISCVYVVPSTLMTFISKVINVKNKMKHNDVLSSALKSLHQFHKHNFVSIVGGKQ